MIILQILRADIVLDTKFYPKSIDLTKNLKITRDLQARSVDKGAQTRQFESNCNKSTYSFGPPPKAE